MNPSLLDELMDFIECSIHSILYVREVYPPSLFEQRRFLGVTIWQSRHPDINSYIRRVLNNARPLMEQDLVDRVVFVTTSSTGVVLDHVTIKCFTLPQQQHTSDGALNMQSEISQLQEELRSTVLRIGLLDAQLPKVAHGIPCLMNQH